MNENNKRKQIVNYIARKMIAERRNLFLLYLTVWLHSYTSRGNFNLFHHLAAARRSEQAVTYEGEEDFTFLIDFYCPRNIDFSFPSFALGTVAASLSVYLSFTCSWKFIQTSFPLSEDGNEPQSEFFIYADIISCCVTQRRKKEKNIK